MIDTTGQDNIDFWNKYYQEDQKRQLQILKDQELLKDGLSYINPDANNGSNDPIPHVGECIPNYVLKYTNRITGKSVYVTQEEQDEYFSPGNIDTQGALDFVIRKLKQTE